MLAHTHNTHTRKHMQSGNTDAHIRTRTTAKKLTQEPKGLDSKVAKQIEGGPAIIRHVILKYMKISAKMCATQVKIHTNNVCVYACM